MSISLAVPFGIFAFASCKAYSAVDDPELDAGEESPHAELIREILLSPYKTNDASEEAIEWRAHIASLRILSSPDGVVKSRMGENSMYLWLPDDTPPKSLPFVALKEFMILSDNLDTANLISTSVMTLGTFGLIKVLFQELYALPPLLTIALILEAIINYYGIGKPHNIEEGDDFAIALMQLHRDELEGAKRFLIQEKLEADSSYLGSALYWFTHTPLEGRIHKIDMALRKLPESFEPTHRLSA